MSGVRARALEAVQELTEALATRAPGVAQGDAEALHDVRVAVRRLRSILRAAERAFEGDDARQLEARLRELGRELGEARDREVLAAELRRSAATTLPGLLERPADAAARSLRSARRAALDALASPEFRRLLADLRSFTADPPPPGRRLSGEDVASRDLRRVRRRATRAERPGLGADEQETLRHEVRKAAKRLRYDLAAFGDGGQANALRDAAERVQDALGTRRDALAVAAVLEGEERRSSGRRAEALARLRRAAEERARLELAVYRQALPELGEDADTGPG
jgi:CHAD domain-containing protein